MARDDMFDPYEQALIWGNDDVGIVITSDQEMRLVKMGDRIIADCLEGAPAQSISADAGLRFWFQMLDSGRRVNRMATLNLFAVAKLSACAVPLLHGPVLITGAGPNGQPAGLSNDQLTLLGADSPNRWQLTILRLRALWRDRGRRRQ
jgi:hypothetical protein